MAYTTIDDPSAHFQVKTYSGNNTQTAITYDGNSNLQPDWIWAKSRSNAHYHDFRDTSRGLTKRLYSNDSDAEDTKSASYVSFNSNGFTLGDDGGGSPANTVNSGSNNYASWGWKANGGTTSSNTGGSITSTVQANTDAGFSIVTYTGNGSDNATVAHGLGKIPAMMIVKNRDDSDHWGVWHQGFAAHTSYNSLSQTIATINNDDIFKAFSSTLFTLGTDSWSNVNNEKFVVYAFAEKQGYSKFGSYTGNGNADGPFIYTGFKPAWIMFKKSSDTGDWIIMDAKRTNEFNPTNGTLYANLTNAEATSVDRGDCVSNGYKLRNTSAAVNTSGATYIYMAFAEHPFVSSKGVPVTAR